MVRTAHENLQKQNQPLTKNALRGIELLENVVLVAGVHGVSGLAAARHWASTEGTRVYGLARRTSPLPPEIEYVNADLLDRDDVFRKVGKIAGVTHLVFAAYIWKPTAAETTEVNVTILKNLLDAVEENSPSLRHVTFYQGGKAGRPVFGGKQ